LLSPAGVKLLSYAGGNLAVSAATLSQDLADTNALSGSDTITGNSAGNVLEGYGGNDTIDGGAGTDTVVERGNRASYSVQNNGTSITVSGPDGTDTLTNVERVRFDDFSLAFDTSGVAGQAYRLYQAALDRAPDAGGLGFYILTLESGWGLHDIAGDFLNSPEFQHTYGNTSNLEFVNLLYENVLHRQGEASGVQFHLNELAQGLDRAQVLVNFSESPENQAALIGVMSAGMLYVPQH
jgi:Ca2+-binding RTX toxin-like protein